MQNATLFEHSLTFSTDLQTKQNNTTLNDMCGDEILVTDTLIVLTCISLKKIQVYNRNNLELIHTESFEEESAKEFYFETIN